MKTPREQSSKGRWLRIAAVLFAFVLIATACGNDDDQTEPAGDSVSEVEQPTPAEDGSGGAPEPTPASSDDEPAPSGDDDDGISEPIRVGSLLDETGPLNIYGTPMADATRLAIADINANGGVLGRQLELVALDSKSDQNEYISGADRLVAEDLAVVHAGITSASREAIRPTFGEG